MKKISVICFLIAIKIIASAQSGEWVNQKRTQKKYLLEQIAALKVYSDYVSKGYSIVRNGINTINNIKRGDLKLHSDYFLSLSVVNPKIRKYVKVADIITIQLSINNQAINCVRRVRASNQFTPTELIYVKQVFDKVLKDCVKNLDELHWLITDGEIKMKDDERIKAIDRIYDDMQDKKVFIQSFSNSTATLSAGRFIESIDIKVSKKLNGIP